MSIKGVSHIHSCYSYDGTLDLNELKTIYKKKDYNFLFLTEHAEKGMTVKKYHTLKKECEKVSDNDFILIPGLEYISKEAYHILAIGVARYEALSGKRIKEILERIRKAGGISILAHPKKYNYQILEEIIPFANGIEVWNTNYDGIRSIKRNILLFKSLLKYNPTLFCFGGIDLHLFEDRKNVVYIKIIEDSRSLSRDKIVNLIEQSKFEIRDNILSISARGNIEIIDYKELLIKLLEKCKSLLILTVISFLRKTEIIKFFNFLSSIQTRAVYPQVEEIKSDMKVLVFSPHPDDEIIGCGGTIYKYIKKGSKVKVVFMTDGRKGNPNIPLNELINIRKKEAKEALDILDCQDMVFLNYSDQKLKCNKETIERVLNILKEYKPRLIYIPFFLDNHPDHRATVKIVASALKQYPYYLECYSYEVWRVLSPNVLIDITDISNRKIKAIRAHETQVENINYPEKIKGLNAYRSLTAGKGVKYCEAFYKCPRKKYIDLAKKMKLI